MAKIRVVKGVRGYKIYRPRGTVEFVKTEAEAKAALLLYYRNNPLEGRKNGPGDAYLLFILTLFLLVCVVFSLPGRFRLHRFVTRLSNDLL